MATVLVTDVKYRVAMPLIRTLSELGHTVVAISFAVEIDGDAPPAFLCRGVSATMLLNGRKELLYACQKYTVDGELPVLLPLGRDTVAYLSEHPELSGAAHVIIAKKSALSCANNKRALHRVARGLGIRVPKEYKKTDVENAISTGNPPYPLVVKFEFGEAHCLTAAKRYRIVHTDDEFGAACREVEYFCEEPLIQEYVEGEGVGCSLLLDKDGCVRSYICHRRLREYPVSGGPSTLCESFYDPALVAESAKLLRAIDFTGIAMVEWKKTADGYCLIECNPRAWGTFPLLAVAESDFVARWVEASAAPVSGASSETIPPPAYITGRRMKFFSGEVRLLLYYLKKRERREAFRILGELFSRRIAFGVLSRKDLRASLCYLFRSL